MKVRLMVMAALAACSAVAMPTNCEIEKADARKMKQIVLPTLNIKPPATLKDVVELLRKASREHDPRKEGVNFVLNIAEGDPVPAVPRIRANLISVYNALDLVLGSVGYDFEVNGDSVVIFKKGSAAKK